MKSRQAALIGLVVLAIISRFAPHPWNWTAIGATALFAGSRFERYLEALVVPLVALFLSDLVLGFHPTMVFVYGAVAATVTLSWFGRDLLRGPNLAAGSMLASVLFFLVTNGGVWLAGGFYPMTKPGLLACYAAGLPFFASQALGDLFYTAVIFGLWNYAQLRTPAYERARARRKSK